MRHILSVFFAIILPLFLASCQTTGTAPVPAVSAPPVPTSAKAALLVPLTGPAQDLGNAMVNAAQLAIVDLGLTSFELVVRDTGNTPDTARMAAQQAIEGGAAILLGPVFADAAAAVKPVALAGNVPMLSFSTHGAVAGGSAYILGILPDAQVNRLVAYARSAGIGPLHLVAPDDAYGSVIADALSRATAGDPALSGTIARLPHDRFAQDQRLTQFSSAVRAAASRRPGVIVAYGGAPLVDIARRLSALGVDGRMATLMGTGLWDDSALASEPLLQGGVFASSDPGMRQAFDRKYQATFGAPAQRLATLAYDAAALAGVLHRTGQGYSAAALTQANGFRGAEGVFRLRPDGLNDRLLSVLSFDSGAIRTVQPAASGF